MARTMIPGFSTYVLPACKDRTPEPDLTILQTTPQEESYRASIPAEPCSPDLSKLKVTDTEEISPTRVQVNVLLLDHFSF